MIEDERAHIDRLRSGKPRSERATQNRVIKMLSEQLGYTYLGNWKERKDNRCIEAGLLNDNLARRGYAQPQISAALLKLQTAVAVGGNQDASDRYNANMKTYRLLRYGVSVQTAPGKAHETVHFIDWEHVENNDFALAEEVTLRGKEQATRRPDVVLYVNGIALVVLELKRNAVEVAQAVRQLISNQEKLFHPDFFSTVQLLLAGSDAQGLRYGTVGTPEKLFTQWKTPLPEETLPEGAYLDTPLAELLDKARLLEFIRDFVIFDAGRKKVPRVHQYRGAKAAQERIKKREGGVIWHTQGSGKSILMVLLAKWLLEFDAKARVLIITDRSELDRQIEGVMRNAGVIGEGSPSPRVESRADLVAKLGQPLPRLMCALIHKFDTGDMEGEPPRVHGQLYVLVDECHRTQGGKMHRQMKRWLQDAVFIGFTGTPLLREDKQTTREVFGTNIHTYKMKEAVADQVVLDLKYEARNVEQTISAADKKNIDKWFDQKTRGLNNFQRAALRRHYATMEKLMSAGGRKGKIVADIIADFSGRPRLNNDRGTAILVASSIYDACHYFRLFQETEFGKYCGIVTSYTPKTGNISLEPEGSDERYCFETYKNYVLLHFKNTDAYENESKRRFIEEPALMKLLIVVDMLLTGFDAPSCTYIYLDKKLRDHNLFQAICRTNRLDGEDKDYGYIVDYKDQFNSVHDALAVYNANDLDHDSEEGGNGDDGNVVVKDWHKEGKKRLDEAREALHYLCEPVPPPRELEQYLRYFCGDADNPAALNETEPLRIAFYKMTAAFIRAYAELAHDLAGAGYTPQEIAAIEQESVFYSEVRTAMKNHAGEELDVKPYEADMRHLINTYIQAEASEKLGGLDELPLTELIAALGVDEAVAKKLNPNKKLSQEAVSEGIINNMRQEMIREQLTDPKFYENISKIFNDLIQKRREENISYQQFLKQIESLAKKMHQGQTDENLPPALQGKPKEIIVLFHNLDGIAGGGKFICPLDDNEKAELALKIDRVMRENAPASWRGDDTREREILRALYPVMAEDETATRAVFEIIKNQEGYR